MSPAEISVLRTLNGCGGRPGPGLTEAHMSGTGPGNTDAPRPGSGSDREYVGGGSEAWKERGVALRVFIYIFATHLFAGFVWILFYVGEHAKK